MKSLSLHLLSFSVLMSVISADYRVEIKIGNRNLQASSRFQLTLKCVNKNDAKYACVRIDPIVITTYRIENWSTITRDVKSYLTLEHIEHAHLLVDWESDFPNAIIQIENITISEAPSYEARDPNKVKSDPRRALVFINRPDSGILRSGRQVSFDQVEDIVIQPKSGDGLTTVDGTGTETTTATTNEEKTDGVTTDDEMSVTPGAIVETTTETDEFETSTLASSARKTTSCFLSLLSLAAAMVIELI